jgi:hypothetical protein
MATPDEQGKTLRDVIPTPLPEAQPLGIRAAQQVNQPAHQPAPVPSRSHVNGTHGSLTKEQTKAGIEDDLEVEVRKNGANYEVRVKPAFVVHTDLESTETPVRIYTEIDGTNTWETVASGDTIYVHASTDENGRVTAAEMGIGGIPDTVRHVPKVDGAGGTDGEYYFKVATVTIAGTVVTVRQHHQGALEIPQDRFPVEHKGSGAKLVQQWEATSGKLLLRSLLAGTGITITQGTDDVTVEATGSGFACDSFDVRLYTADCHVDFTGETITYDSLVLQKTLYFRPEGIYFNSPPGTGTSNFFDINIFTPVTP